MCRDEPCTLLVNRTGQTRTKAVDAHASGRSLDQFGPRCETRRHLQPVADRLNLGVQSVKVQIRRNQSLLQADGSLQEARQASRALEMAHDCLDGAYVQGRAARVVAEAEAESLVDGGSLSRIPGLGACPVRLEVLGLVSLLLRVQAGFGVRLADQRSLGLGARDCEPVGEAVLVGARLADDALNMVAVGNGVAQPLHYDGCDSLTAATC